MDELCKSAAVVKNYIASATKAYTDPNLKKIEAALDNIKKEYKMEEGQEEINEALSGLYARGIGLRRERTSGLKNTF